MSSLRAFGGVGVALLISVSASSGADSRGSPASWGSTRTGMTSTFGSGTITRYSDGSSKETTPFGNGSLTKESDRLGRTTRSGTTSTFGSGTITRYSDGSSKETTPFGSGSLTRETPGRSSSSTSGRSWFATTRPFSSGTSKRK